MSEATEQPQALHAQIAQRLFGWTWRASADRWMTPDDDPVLPEDLPAYSANPAAAALVWQWLEGQPGFSGLTFSYGVQDGIECLVCFLDCRAFQGTGATWPEALCRAALALAQALEEEETR
jgi:hypothetical protein